MASQGLLTDAERQESERIMASLAQFFETVNAAVHQVNQLQQQSRADADRSSASGQD